jgi:hypothetical protein
MGASTLCEVLTKPNLVQKWPCQNEVLDLCKKTATSRVPHFKSLVTNLYTKRINILFVTNLEGILNFIKKYWW